MNSNTNRLQSASPLSDPAKVVSVIIPAYNEERYLGACLESIDEMAGDFVLETIVVNNGSTDATSAIAEAHGARVIHTQVTTIAAQRNAGAREARAPLLAFLDADCTVLNGWADVATRHFRDDAVVGAGSSPCIPVSDTTWVQRAWAFLKRKAAENPVDVSWIASANLWVRKTSFESVGGFDETLETCEDADLGYRLKDIGRLISDPKVAAVHHREPRTLRDFYRKEVWHGKNSFSGVASGRLRLAELPSLLAPVGLVASVLVAIIGLCMIRFPVGYWLLLLGIAGLLAVPAMYTIRACLKKGNWGRFPQYVLIYFVYFVARVVALLRWLREVLRGSR